MSVEAASTEAWKLKKGITESWGGIVECVWVVWCRLLAGFMFDVVQSMCQVSCSLCPTSVFDVG